MAAAIGRIRYVCFCLCSLSLGFSVAKVGLDLYAIIDDLFRSMVRGLPLLDQLLDRAEMSTLDHWGEHACGRPACLKLLSLATALPPCCFTVIKRGGE